MKRNWLLYLVIFSLALNFGTIGALVYGRWQYQPLTPAPERGGAGFLRLLHSLELDPQQKEQLQQSYPSHRQQLSVLRRQIAAERERLFTLLSQPQPQEAEIAAQITAINNLQNALEQEMARFLLAFKQNLRPAQQEILLQHVQRRLCDPHYCRPSPKYPRGRGGPPAPVPAHE